MASLKGMAADSANTSVKKTDRFKVAPHLLKEDPGFNLRDYDDPDTIEHIERFAQSYAAGQYVPPLLLRVADNGDIFVVEGHCRRRGALLAITRGHDIPFLNADQFNGNDLERIEVMMTSSEGLKLKPLAQAFGILRLHRMGQSNDAIADRLHRSAANVEQLLKLATANHDVHHLVREGKVEAYTAIDALRKYGEQTGEYLAGLLADVQTKGGTKVTKGAVTGRALPRKVINSLVAATTTFAARLDHSARRQLAELDGLPPEQLEGKTVSVDASVLLELFRAQQAIEDVQKKRDDAAKASEDAARQQSLDDVATDEEPGA